MGTGLSGSPNPQSRRVLLLGIPQGSNPSAAESSWERGRCPLSPNLGLQHCCRGAGWPKMTWLLSDFFFLAYLQAKAERNYHIFYQLCASATLPELQGLGLRECPHEPRGTARCQPVPCWAVPDLPALPGWMLEKTHRGGIRVAGSPAGQVVLVHSLTHLVHRWGRVLPLHLPGPVHCCPEHQRRG